MLLGNFVPILRQGEMDIISYSAEQTKRLGQRLGRLLQPGDVICLSGDMGAGKTVFSSGIGQGWGVQNHVTSPTYNLVHQHQREADTHTLYHLDCYRLQNVDEVDSIGFDDIIDANGMVIIEWAERILEALPDERMWIELRVVETHRRNFAVEPIGTRYENRLKQFRQSIFGV